MNKNETSQSDSQPSFRFTTGGGSALLYYGDEFVAKFSSKHVKAFTAVLTANEIMRTEIDSFTQYVGALTFQEARDVLIRTNAENMDQLEIAHNRVKEQGRVRIAALKAVAETLDSFENASLLLAHQILSGNTVDSLPVIAPEKELEPAQ